MVSVVSEAHAYGAHPKFNAAHTANSPACLISFFQEVPFAASTTLSAPADIHSANSHIRLEMCRSARKTVCASSTVQAVNIKGFTKLAVHA